MKPSFFAISTLLLATGCGASLKPASLASYECVESALRANPTPEDVLNVKIVLTDGCQAGSQEACSALGVMVEKGIGFDSDKALARKLFEGACRGGVVRACTSLGRLERPENPRAAATLFRTACSEGDVHGCAELGRLTRDAVGAVPDSALAEELFERACSGGDATACGDLVSLPSATDARIAAAALQGCALGDARSCAAHMDGKVADPPWQAAPNDR